MNQPILELKNIKKVYPGVVALKNVSMKFYPGEVHAIVGENGAGKSTFIKTITGAIQPTEGKIFFEGKEIVNNNPIKSLSLGITAIYQEFNLIPYLSVAENIYYGRFPQKFGFVDYKTMYKNAKKVLDWLGIDINPKTIVKDLSVGYQQIVEIAKSISMNSRVLIMDEPSAPLTNNELKYLFNVVKKLTQQGVAIIYISHRMEEIFDLCHKVTVFRDGEYIKTMNVADTNKNDLFALMVNRKLNDNFPNRNYTPQEVVLEVEGLTTSKVSDISFKLHKGEILGFAGLVGAGRTEIALAIYGADKVRSGSITLKGKRIINKSPAQAIKNGIALIPEDRKKFGALMNMTIKENISYSMLKKIAWKFGIIKANFEKKTANEYKDVLSIKTPSINQKVINLSGGNQQKVILARCMFTDCEILIFDEPTRGIDIGAKQEIYALMNSLTQQGKSIIIISSEMPELLGMADRILVVYNGKIAGELLKKDADQQTILKLASGCDGGTYEN
ncbi:MAG TPA: sugar ABC transporter ATP-binding protein [Clostridiaceae bacterium]|nr:sugar ABC transporter ATP-binding protein [Clostridiaceae bacterium]